jgi:hypothetical protein
VTARRLVRALAWPTKGRSARKLSARVSLRLGMLLLLAGGGFVWQTERWDLASVGGWLFTMCFLSAGWWFVQWWRERHEAEA